MQLAKDLNNLESSLQRESSTEESEVKALKGFAKFCKDIADQLRAVYDPDLIPLYGGGIIIGWIDSRTGERPWFS